MRWQLDERQVGGIALWSRPPVEKYQGVIGRTAGGGFGARYD